MPEQSPDFHTHIVTANTLVSGGAVGAAFGAKIASLFPASVDFAPGVAANVSLRTDVEGASIAYGPTVVNMPHVPVETGPLHFGVQADITRLDVALHNSDSLNTYAGLFSQYQEGIVDPVKHALIEHLATGAGIGAVAMGALSLGGLQAIRMYKELKRQQVHNPEGSETMAQTAPNRWRRMRKALLTPAVATVALAGCGWGVKEVTTDSRPPARPVTALPSEITSLNPMLKDATVTNDFVGSKIKLLLYGIKQYSGSVQTFWEDAATTFKTEQQAFAAAGNMDYESDPNIIPMLHVSDFHCNQAEYTYFMSDVLSAYRPGLILNTGDTFTNSGTMFYEKGCYSNFSNKVATVGKQIGRQIPIVNIEGNHDLKKPIPSHSQPIITLDKHRDYTAVVDGITFVGDQDLENTVWGVPNTRTEAIVNQKLAEQSTRLGNIACTITRESGIPPIILTHRKQAAYSPVLQGCATLSLSGHTHHDEGVKRIKGADGNIVTQHTEGSASGADIGFTVYETPKQTASMSLWLYDKTLHNVTGYISLKLYTDGKVHIVKHELPTSLESPDGLAFMQKFLDIHTSSTPVKQR
jgi:predicted MPP superfamily phosphohydrolase